jgi:tetratricopeptide (TPR) repeat protein
MSYTEIIQLKNLGRIEEAYLVAKEQIESGDADMNLIRTFALMSKQMVMQYLVDKQLKDCLKIFANYSLLADVPAEESGVYSNMTDSLREFVKQINQDTFSLWDDCFQKIQSIPLQRAGKGFTFFVKSVLKLKDWQGLNAFAYWCGIEGLHAEDYEPYKMDNGKSIMALAEQLSIKAAKYLLETNDHDSILTFIPQLENLYHTHPRYTYPPYFLTKLYAAVGQTDKAIAILLPFIRKKSNDFWVWQLMAELHDEMDTQIMYYCKAIDCGSRKQEMLVSVYAQLANLFHRKQNYPMARWFVDECCKVRQHNGWSISAELQHITREAWYRNTTAQYDKAFVSDQTKKAEQIAHITSKAPRNRPHPNKQEPTVSFTGKIQLNAKGFGFVHDITIGDVFIPQYLANQLAHGVEVNGMACKRFDKSRQQWGYAAVKINRL